jgi:hypothetical protein
MKLSRHYNLSDAGRQGFCNTLVTGSARYSDGGPGVNHENIKSVSNLLMSPRSWKMNRLATSTPMRY